jgi:hypothetical protein
MVLGVVGLQLVDLVKGRKSFGEMEILSAPQIFSTDWDL